MPSNTSVFANIHQRWCCSRTSANKEKAKLLPVRQTINILYKTRTKRNLIFVQIELEVILSFLIKRNLNRAWFSAEKVSIIDNRANAYCKELVKNCMKRLSTEVNIILSRQNKKANRCLRTNWIQRQS